MSLIIIYLSLYITLENNLVVLNCIVRWWKYFFKTWFLYHYLRWNLFRTIIEMIFQKLIAKILWLIHFLI